MVIVNGSITMSRNEIVQIIEQGAGARRGMTARELLSTYSAGELEEPGEVADLLALGDLLPDDDSILTAG